MKLRQLEFVLAYLKVGYISKDYESRLVKNLKFSNSANTCLLSFWQLSNSSHRESCENAKLTRKKKLHSADVMGAGPSVERKTCEDRT